MKKTGISILLAFMILASSCGTHMSLQKRRYSRGFYFSSNHSKPSVKPREEAPVLTKVHVTPSGDKTMKATEEVVTTAPENNAQTTSKASASSSPVAEQRTTSQSHSSYAHASEKKLTTSLKQNSISKLKRSVVKSRDEIAEFFYSAYIGYYVISFLILVFYLYTELGLMTTLAVLLILALILVVCYAIGSFFRNIFGIKAN
mgnify:CR=1 FL=1